MLKIRDEERTTLFEILFGITLVLFLVFLILFFKEKINSSKLKAEKDALEKHIPEQMKNMSNNLAKEHSESFERDTVKPMKELMEGLDAKLIEISKQNSANTEIFSNIKTIQKILTDSGKRGNFSEMQIERVLQMGGFKKDIHYETQKKEGEKRPDFIIHLPDARDIIIDSKSPMESLEKAFQAEDDDSKNFELDNHVKDVKSHIRNLSKKEYAEERSLEYVVMVVPEYALLPAVERDNKLTEFALENKVILVTPSILLILINAIHLTWKQNNMLENVKEIDDLATTLYDRLKKFIEYYNDIGEGIDKVVEKYNSGSSSWEKRLIPSIEKLSNSCSNTKEIPEINKANEVVKKISE